MQWERLLVETRVARPYQHSRQGFELVAIGVGCGVMAGIRLLELPIVRSGMSVVLRGSGCREILSGSVRKKSARPATTAMPALSPRLWDTFAEGSDLDDHDDVKTSYHNAPCPATLCSSRDAMRGAVELLAPGSQAPEQRVICTGHLSTIGQTLNHRLDGKRRARCSVALPYRLS